MWVNKRQGPWFFQVPDTGMQMGGGVNKRASSGFHSWVQPINMYVGSHESFRAGLVAVFIF